MAFRTAGHGTLHELDTHRFARRPEPAHAHTRTAEHRLLRTAVLPERLATADAPLCQYGHAGGTVYCHIVPLQHLQHLLGPELLGLTGYRVAHLLRRLRHDYYLCTDRATPGGTCQARNGKCHPCTDGTAAQDRPSGRCRTSGGHTAGSTSAWRHHRGATGREDSRRRYCGGRCCSLHRRVDDDRRVCCHCQETRRQGAGRHAIKRSRRYGAKESRVPNLPFPRRRGGTENRSGQHHSHGAGSTRLQGACPAYGRQDCAYLCARRLRHSHRDLPCMAVRRGIWLSASGHSIGCQRAGHCLSLCHGTGHPHRPHGGHRQGCAEKHTHQGRYSP